MNYPQKEEFIQDNGILIEINPEGYCIKANSALTDCTGFFPHEILGKKLKDFLTMDSIKLHEIESIISSKKDIVISFDCIFRHKNGSPVYMKWNLFWLELYKEVLCVGRMLGLAEQKIIKENEELHLLNKINECIQNIHTKENLFSEVCKILINTGRFILVWLGKIDKASKVEILNKEADKYLTHESFDESSFISYVFEKRISPVLNGKPQTFRISKDEIAHLLPGLNIEIASCAIVTIDCGKSGQIILSLTSANPDEFDEHQLSILEQISKNISNSMCMLENEQQRIQNIIILNKYVHECTQIKEINDQILTVKDETFLINQILTILVKSGGYKLAWLAFFEINKEKEKPIIPTYYFGETDYAKKLVFDLNIPEILNGPTATCILTHKTIVTNSTQDDRYYLHWKKDASQHGLNSSICIYLDIPGSEKGTIAIYSAVRNAFEISEINFLERIANNLTYAIGNIRTNDACMQNMKGSETFKKV